MQEGKDVQYHVVEGLIDHFDRINRRLIAVVILLIVLLVGSNVAWIIYESQFEYFETDMETDVSAVQWGDSNMVSGGDMYYGSGSEGKD